ncbi:glycine C-acetyltransferase [Candidatus Uhrbacteria bacterium]|nr:glycine C-acetyltransferase [Candidatus Uhrbacteria bacterium]
MYSFQDQLQQELEEIKSAGMYKEEKVIEGRQGAQIMIDGKKLLNFCGNNYLGLASSSELVKAAQEGMERYGFGMASVPFICGTNTLHKDLEAEVARFFRQEDAILYTSCFDANTGLFETILKEGDAIFSDELNHASIIDGVRLCKAERFRYKNCDMDDLENQLKTSGNRRRKLIATDGVFSMDGITATLKEICDLADTYGASVMVDDSHASGVLGKTGRGSIEQAGVMDRVDIVTSTFGKALGGAGGGFTAGRKEIINVLRQRSRTTLFSNSVSPAITAAALYVLQNFDGTFSHLRGQLIENTYYFRSGMEKLGFTLGGDGTHPITPVMLFEEKLATEMASALFEKGIYVRGFTYPVVPKGKARIRVQISAAHTKEHLDTALHAFKEIKENS